MGSSAIVSEHCPQCGAPLTVGDQRLTCAYCGTSLVRQVSPKAGATGGWGVHLKTVTCIDQQGIGIEAFRLLIPATWEFEGGVHSAAFTLGMRSGRRYRRSRPSRRWSSPDIGDRCPACRSSHENISPTRRKPYEQGASTPPLRQPRQTGAGYAFAIPALLRMWKRTSSALWRSTG